MEPLMLDQRHTARFLRITPFLTHMTMRYQSQRSFFSTFIKGLKRPVMGILCIAVCSSSIANAQIGESSPFRADTSRVDVSRISIFGGIVLASGLTVHFARYTPLWPEYYSSFRFRENFTYAQNQDKLLHFYGSFVGSSLSAKGLSWAGFDERDAALYGSAASLLFLTYMKIEDGHISYLGFDRVDEAANTLGAIYPAAQYYVPWLKSFTPKASYAISHNNVVMDAQKMPGFLEDHEGQKFWMGITVHDVLPLRLQEYWPSLIGVAVGYTVRGLNTAKPYHETFVALDCDLRKLPGDSQFLKTLWQVLNYIHLPMPAVRVSPKAVWYGLYF